MNRACPRATRALLAVCVFSMATPLLRAQETTESRAIDAETQRRRQEEVADRARRLVGQVADRAREAKGLVDALAHEVSTLNERTQALLTNDEGRRLAQDSLAFFVFVRMQEDPVVTPQEVEARRNAIGKLIESLEREMKRDALGYTPGVAIVEEIEGIRFWGADRLARVKERAGWLSAALERADRSNDVAKLPTLKARMEADSAAREEALARAGQRGRDAGAQSAAEQVEQNERLIALNRGLADAERRLREANAQIERMKIEHDLQLKQQEQELRRAQVEADIRLRDAEAELERMRKLADARREAENLDSTREADKVLTEAQKRELVDRCKSEEVQTRLAPFITPGYYQPARSAEMTVDKMPMSLSKLRAFGALSNTPEGYKKLIIVGSYSKDKVRPRWGFDYALVQSRSAKDIIGQLRPDQMDGLKTVQGYLNELGPTLVELGMLSP